MRTIGQLRNSGTTRAPRRIALIAASFGVLAATLGLGVAASGRVAAHHAAHHVSTRTTADTSAETTNDYSGGRLMTADPNGGYWTVSWLGTVTGFAGAPTFGSPALSGITLSKPIVAMAATPDGQGYWLVGSDGGVFAYGDANFYGSTGAIHLNEPIVGMAATSDGLGYWLVASDGGIFTYGDANFYGSTGAIHLNRPIVGMSPTPDGQGYWLVASDGGIFSFGNASFYGSTGAIHLNQPIVGMAPTPDGQGYWLVASDGGIFTFGDAPFDGSLGASSVNVLGIMVSPPTTGYTLVALNGTASQFSSPSATSSEPTSNASSDFTTQPTVTTFAPDAAQSANDCQPSTAPSATVDSALDNVIDKEAGPGWVGGDETYSTQLPDGHEVFDFSDTLIGTATSSGSASLTGFIHNSEMAGPVSDLATVIGGTESAPQTLIPDTTPTAQGDQWEVAATDMENGSQLVFVNEFAPVPGSQYDRFTGHSAIAVMAVSASGLPSLRAITPVPTDAYTQWGNALMQSGSYTYIYGSDFDAASNNYYGMKVARVPLGGSLDISAWQYWNGAQWVSGEGNAVADQTITVLTGVTPQQGGTGYEAVSIPGWEGGDTTVDLAYSCSPAGPWSSPTPVYTIPQVTQDHDEVSYFPTFHPELSGAGGLVVSYNIDSTDGLPALEQNDHLYQPQFIQLSTGF
jgi:hypothetical protein